MVSTEPATSLMVSYSTIGKDLVEILEARKRGVFFHSIDLFDSDPIISGGIVLFGVLKTWNFSGRILIRSG
jgi:hypothetical protein